MPKMFHDQFSKPKPSRKSRRRLQDISGLRQIPISDIHTAPAISPKPPQPVGGDPAQLPRTPISGRSPRIEPPLDRPLNQPSGPPFPYGYDRLGTTSAPPRYVQEIIPEIGRVTHRDVAESIDEARGELAKGIRIPAPEGWPHSLEAGVPGTGIFSGFLSAGTTGEFNPDMYGWNAMRVYEQMRRTDADVAVSLFAMKLPIFSVTPEIIPGETEGGGNGNLAKELAAFVRECLFGGLERENPVIRNTWVSQSFDEVKENAFLMLDFGCSAHENLWRVDGDRIRLRYLAPRLPHTFYRFWTAEDGETLTGLEQLGYRRERYISTTIPANQLCLFTNRKEGSNFFGISSLRAAYQHWYTKSHFYRIDAIAMERNGMGIPWIKFPPGAKREDVTKAQAWVEQMAVSERTGLALPDGYTFEIAGLRGRLRDPINSIKHHSQEIVRSVMAMFIALGTTETGSRALANTLLDLFRQSLQHYTQVFCSTFNSNTIRPLVDYNYSARNGHSLPYPKLVFPSIVVIDPVETAEVLSKLGNSQVDIVRPTRELEKRVLQIFGMPDGAARTKYAPTMTQVRIMAQPVGEESIEETREGRGGIEGQSRRGDQPQSPEPGKVAPTGQGDEFVTRGSGQQIHDTINKITTGHHGTASKSQSQPSNGHNRTTPTHHLSDLTEFQGIPIFIENEPGSIRTGTNPDGTEWSAEMKRPYGYIKGVLGLDQEELDCFIGPYKKAKNVYIVRTKDPSDGTIDEEKVFLGFRGITEAKNTFLHHYDSPDHFRSIKSMPFQRFKEWMKSMGGRVHMVDTPGGHYIRPSEIGFDLDGTLAEHVEPFNPNLVGDPIPSSVEKVKRLQDAGYKVWIFTARTDLRPVIRWALDHNLNIPATNRKRPEFIMIVDDRAEREDDSVSGTLARAKELEHYPSKSAAKKD